MKRITTAAVAAVAAASLAFGVGVTTATAATVSTQATSQCRTLQDVAKANYDKAKADARATYLKVRDEQKTIANNKIAALKKDRDEKRAAYNDFEPDPSDASQKKLIELRDVYFAAANAVGPGMMEARRVQRATIAEALKVRNAKVADAKVVRDNAIKAARAMC